MLKFLTISQNIIVTFLKAPSKTHQRKIILMTLILFGPFYAHHAAAQVSVDKPDIKVDQDGYLAGLDKSYAQSTCDAAKADVKQLRADIKKECDAYGTTDCVNRAVACGERSGEDGDSPLSSILGMGMGSMFGTTSLPGMGKDPESIACEMGTDSIKKWKEMQKDLYDEAKDSWKEAKERQKEIQDQADELTNEKSSTMTEMAESLKEFKNLAAQYPLKVRRVTDDIQKKAAEARSSINSMLLEQAKLEKDKVSAQSLITQAYARHMGPCLDKKAENKIMSESTAYALKAEYDAELGKIGDLRKREQRKKELLSRLNAQQQLGSAKANTEFATCQRNAQAAYTADNEAMTLTITAANQQLAALKDEITAAQAQLKSFPDMLDKAKKALNDEFEGDREEAKTNFEGAQAKIRELTQNYNNRLNASQVELFKTQVDYTNKQMAHQMASSVVEASLGNVRPLLGDIGDAECTMYLECQGVSRISKKDRGALGRLQKNCDGRESKKSFLDEAVDQEVLGTAQ